MTTSIVLLSGGMDSAACLLWALERGSAEAMFVDYGQRAAMSENVASRAIAARLGVLFHFINAPMVGGIAGPEFNAADAVACVVPARNITLVSLAAGLCSARGGGRVVIGCCADDAAAFPDCRALTLQSLAQTLLLAGLRTELVAPFVEMSKREIVTWADERGRRDVLEASVSCYLGTGCGECHACRSRAAGFAPAEAA